MPYAPDNGSSRKKPEQREALLGCPRRDCRWQTLFCNIDVDTATHEIMLIFFGEMCRWKSFVPSLRKNIMLEAEIKEPTVIYMERPLRKAEYTIHIEVPPNPFWASVGLSIEPLPIGSGVQYEARVFFHLDI